MLHTRTHLALLLVLATAPALAVELGSPSSAGGGLDADVRAALHEALEAQALPPVERPLLPEAATPAPSRRSGKAPGVGVQEKAAAHAAARAQEVLERLRQGEPPGRAQPPGREVDAATAQDRVKRVRRQGAAPLPPTGNGSPPDGHP